MTLGRLEAEKRARGDIAGLAVDSHPHRSVDDRDPGILPDLVLPEFLTRSEDDQHRPRTVIFDDDDGVSNTFRRRNRQQIPRLHGGSLRGDKRR